MSGAGRLRVRDCFSPDACKLYIDPTATYLSPICVSSKLHKLTLRKTADKNTKPLKTVEATHPPSTTRWT